jgi:type I restriction enzyme S subunit
MAMAREYKDSGIEWIGRIPKEWNITKLGSLYTQRNEKVSDKDYAPLSVTMQGILPQLETAAKTDDGDNRKLVKKGDFAINSRSDRRGSCGISPYDGSVSLINIILKPRGEMNPIFYNWLFHTSLFADEFYKWGHGIVDDLWTTRWQEMKSISVAVPSLPEQQKIAEYLDVKCGEIDSLISLQEQMIAQLTDYKQSVITEAVTKGLDPNVELIPSGIDWIGDIPKEWKMVKLSLLTTKIGSGSTPNGGATVYVNEGVKFLRSQNVYFEGLDLTDVAHITDEIDEEMKGTRVKPGDVLLNITGGSIGRCYYVDSSLGRANVNQHVSIIRPSKIETKYLKYYLQSFIGQIQVSLLQTGGNREGLSAAALSNFMILYPSTDEQIIIASFLDNKCAEIDALIALKQQKIETLKDYKKSLIYEAVTGKLEI